MTEQSDENKWLNTPQVGHLYFSLKGTLKGKRKKKEEDGEVGSEGETLLCGNVISHTFMGLLKTTDLHA